MSGLRSMSHPGFEALSAHADLDDVSAARTRVGEHVARCSACRETIDDIRAMGAAARDIVVEDVPATLWTRIEAASAQQGATSSSASVLPLADLRPEDTASDVAAPRRARRNLAIGGLMLAAIAALAAIVLVPSRSTLMATGTSRLTFSPARPVAGGVLTVRYRPVTSLAGAPRLLLAGRFALAATHPDPPELRRDIDTFADSLATLRPTGDGSYEGTLRLPPDFLAVHLFVADSLGEPRDGDGRFAWLAIGGTARGAPSLDALLAAHDRMWVGLDASDRTPPTQLVSIADSIQRYFPGHPAGWAYYERYGVRRGVLDLLSFFETAERKYTSLDARLWPMKHLDAERLHDMALLARRISEPGETRKWVDRLVREHPDDPRALRDLAESLHDIELKPVDRIADSIAPLVPLLDSLRRLRAGARPPERAIYLVQTYGDAETRARWPENAGMPLGFVFRALSDRALDTTASSVAYARRIATASCERPAGKLVLNAPTAFWSYVCRSRKAATWSYLSLVSLAKGNAADAISLADSGLSAGRAMCNANAPTRARARARLASGDTAGAAHDYAVAFGQMPRPEEAPDALAARLGAHLRRAEFDSISASTNRAVRACERARAAADLARRNRDR